MGADPEDDDAADCAPPPPGTNKVEITVAGHSVTIESTDPLAAVADCALDIFQRTAGYAKRIPIGFDVAGGQFERADPYREPRGLEGWEDDDARGLGRQQAQGGATRRLGLDGTPGGHRTRLRPLQVD